MSQMTQFRGQNAPFSRTTIEEPAPGHVKLIVQVPTYVSLRSQVGIQLSDKDAVVSAPFDRCIPAGCIAEFELKDDVLEKFLSSEDIGKVIYKDAVGNEIDIPLSFKGFYQAFDALPKE